MPRPSQNVDQLLLDAGRELLPLTGCTGFSVRRLVEHAGVNLGMFHYHFKTKENFIRTVLQQTYEEMFAELTLHTGSEVAPIDHLRDALIVLARFGRKNRLLLVRIMTDAMAGNVLATQFLKANLPRHIRVINGLITQGQEAGFIAKVPVPQVTAFLAGAIALPILIGSAFQQDQSHSRDTKQMNSMIDHHVLSDLAIAQRISFALQGIKAEGERT